MAAAIKLPPKNHFPSCRPATVVRPPAVSRGVGGKTPREVYRFGARNFAGQNPSFGTSLHYYLSAKAKNVALEIVNVKGEVIRKLKVEKKPGLHRASWDLRRAGRRGSRGQRGRGAAPVKPGAYLARLTVDGKTLVQEIQVKADPERPAALLQEELEQHERKNRPAYIE